MPAHHGWSATNVVRPLRREPRVKRATPRPVLTLAEPRRDREPRLTVVADGRSGRDVA